MPAFNKGNVIRGGFGSTFLRIVCHGDYKDRVRDRARGRRNLGNLNVLVIVFVLVWATNTITI